MLEQLLATGIFSFFLVFARLGSAMLLLPGFGEAYVSPRIRLTLALALSFVLTPLVSAGLPPLPAAPLGLLTLLGGEAVVGLFLGTVTRVMLMTLQIAGAVVALQMNLANAMTNDPATAQQAAVVSNFFMALGLVLIFATDLHHLMLRALVDSYALFPAGRLPEVGDMSALITRVVGGSFLLGVQMAVPFIVAGLVLNIGVGLLARLMPQIQVLAIAMPAQVAFGFLVLVLTTSVGMLWFLNGFTNTLSDFTVGP
jgi:flagellar biosynthetic protein FliR